MYERLLIVIVAAVLGATVYLLLRRSQLNRAQNAAVEQNGVQLKAGILHIVYFWSEHCSQCKNAQKPILEGLLEKVGQENVELLTLRVEDFGSIAKSWGVRTLPTTYIVDQKCNVTHVNNGLTSESHLLLQLNLNTD
ncbi:thioredoxin family protein [Sulfuriflexus mobilis]|uniref:thioredoxin family protein n=1 Tax=Sulfuriflexus mobilis TaxID=1811807 RepID=UPI000F83B362|nr:thioredoxin family protein [Sulfuriflexus mobilis]